LISSDLENRLKINSKLTLNLIILGMAGSGKTTFVKKLEEEIAARERESYIINMDPSYTTSFDNKLILQSKPRVESTLKNQKKKLFQIRRVASSDSGCLHSSRTLWPSGWRSSSSFSAGVRAKNATSEAEAKADPTNKMPRTANVTVVVLASTARNHKLGRGSASKIGN
jgi:hypothetical protein